MPLRSKPVRRSTADTFSRSSDQNLHFHLPIVIQPIRWLGTMHRFGYQQTLQGDLLDQLARQLLPETPRRAGYLSMRAESGLRQRHNEGVVRTNVDAGASDAADQIELLGIDVVAVVD